MPAPPAGLCNACRSQRVIATTRGSAFSMCLRHKDDPRFPKYPRLPVGACPGYVPRGSGDDSSPQGAS